MRRKKFIAGFELVLMVVSVFAFSFMIGAATPDVDGVPGQVSPIRTFFAKVVTSLKKPIVPTVSAQTATSQPSECCEKTNDGAYCINTEASNCASGFKSAPSSCETTSYCRLGTCYDSEEGICMANTPQRVCDDNGGTWDSRDINEVPQCQLGCCIIAEQAAFVPLVRCKRLSTLFGVSNDYRTDISSEVQCIATAQSQDVGACVYDKDFERICEFTTRGECDAGQEVEAIGGNISDGAIETTGGKKFYEDYLCSAEELNTACAKQTSTGCFNGKVYEFDSCGNRENVYSSNKGVSWNNGRVALPLEVCNGNDGSEKGCGNCEYLLGSRCAEWEGLLGIGKPSGSDYYCQTTECVDRAGDKRMNGESWCVNDGLVGGGSDPAGSRYYKEVCVDGEVRVEPCADRRAEVCISGSIETSAGDFETAACTVNKWQNCFQIDDEDDCLNIDKFDCMWLPAVTGMVLGGGNAEGSTSFSNPTANEGDAFENPTGGGSFTGNVIAPITGNALLGGDDEDDEEEGTTTNRPGGVCVPNFPPGLEFWKEGNAKQCGVANAKCAVVYEKGLIGSSWSCVENCECLEDGWAGDANRVCAALGDCGGYVNFQGEYTDDGYVWTVDGAEKEFSPNTINKISGGFTGLVTALTGLVAGGFGFITGKQVVGGVGELVPATVTLAGGGPNPTYITTPNQGVVQLLGKTKTNYNILLSNGQKGTIPLNSEIIEATRSPVQEAFFGTEQSSLFADGAPALTETSLTDAGFTNIQTSGNTVTSFTTEGGQVYTAGTDGAFTAVGQRGGSSWLSNTLGGGNWVVGGGLDTLVSGFQWAAVAYLAGQVIGPMLGLSADNTDALSTALAAGFGTFKVLSTYNFAAEGAILEGNTFLGAHAGLIGLGIGVAVFLVMYKDSKVEIVEFNCLPWQAPTGGDVCEECNDDDLPCSEYRCRALGQNCELVNPGSDQERCVTVRRDDVDPPIISPNEEELSNGHGYTNVKLSPPGPGFNIINLNSSDGCLKAFTPLEFGINTDEPAQCKIDFNHTLKFDDMAAYFGGSNLYAYNHSERFSLPGVEDLKNASFILENGKDWQFYMRCKDKNGNENSAEYAVNFCIDPTPDSTAPTVEATSIINGGCVAEDQADAEVEFYTNEPADCRWSKQDQDFDNMQNTMACSNQLYQMNALQLFTCKAILTGVPREEETFYIRCKDQPGKDDNYRIKNAESYVFSLRGSTGLKLKNLQPNETIFGAVRPAPVELYAETLFGCNDGRANCFYSTEDNDNTYIKFFDTDNEDGIHTQLLNLNEGNHKYYVKCVDEGGNVVKDSVDFRLDIDENAPVVARVYEEDDLLKLVTVRDSECAYSFDNCDFTFAEGTEMPYGNSTVHVAEWNEDKTFYIKCRDEFRNEDADCSVIVRPSRNFL
jgi:hypothetical protein